MNEVKKTSTEKLVIGAILSALVVLLQYMGSFIKFGPFSISLVLIPIVIGTATIGAKMGAWLGFIFGVAVLISGDASLFLVVNVPGTILTVLLKGTLCGYIAGLLYNLTYKVSKGNTYISTVISAIACPVINTGIFLLGCVLFFMGTISGWAEASGFSGNAGQYMIVVLVGFNFVFELLTNIIFSPVIVRIINIVRK